MKNPQLGTERREMKFVVVLWSLCPGEDSSFLDHCLRSVFYRIDHLGRFSFLLTPITKLVVELRYTRNDTEFYRMSPFSFCFRLTTCLLIFSEKFTLNFGSDDFIK